MRTVKLTYVEPEDYDGLYPPQDVTVVGEAAAGTPGPAGPKGDTGATGPAGAPGYPTLPTADGTYSLKVTRTAGAGAPAWVLDA